MSETFNIQEPSIKFTSGKLNAAYIQRYSGKFFNASTTLMNKATKIGSTDLSDYATLYKVQKFFLTSDEIKTGAFIEDDGEILIENSVALSGEVDGMKFSEKATFDNLDNNSSDYVNFLYYNGIAVVIHNEVAITRKFYNFSNLSIKEVEPYQPISEIISGSAVIKTYSISTSGLSLTNTKTVTGTDELATAIKNCYGANDYYTTTNTTTTLVSTPENGYSSPSSIPISVGSWDNEFYSVVSTGSTYRIYFGQEVDTDSVNDIMPSGILDRLRVVPSLYTNWPLDKSSAMLVNTSPYLSVSTLWIEDTP